MISAISNKLLRTQNQSMKIYSAICQTKGYTQVLICAHSVSNLLLNARKWVWEFIGRATGKEDRKNEQRSHLSQKGNLIEKILNIEQMT